MFFVLDNFCPSTRSSVHVYPDSYTAATIDQLTTFYELVVQSLITLWLGHNLLFNLY